MTTMTETLPETAETRTGTEPRPCVTPGCIHTVTEPWEESGLLCYECAIEGELYDREARWDHVCPIPGTHCLPCDERVARKTEHLSRLASTRPAR